MAAEVPKLVGLLRCCPDGEQGGEYKSFRHSSQTSEVSCIFLPLWRSFFLLPPCRLLGSLDLLPYIFIYSPHHPRRLFFFAWIPGCRVRCVVSLSRLGTFYIRFLDSQSSISFSVSWVIFLLQYLWLSNPPLSTREVGVYKLWPLPLSQRKGQEKT